jgi:hypothetical protein
MTKHSTKADDKPTPQNTEGESQSNYLWPSEGGTYYRQGDGSLRRGTKDEHKPTQPADVQTGTDNAKE